MTGPAGPQQAAFLRGRWLWLFPATYAIHIAEEGLAGERFYRWIRRVAGREIGPGAFLAVNLGYEAVMVVAVRQLRGSGKALWLVPALGTVTAANGIGSPGGQPAHPELFTWRGVRRRCMGSAWPGLRAALAAAAAPAGVAAGRPGGGTGTRERGTARGTAQPPGAALNGHRSRRHPQQTQTALLNGRG